MKASALVFIMICIVSEMGITQTIDASLELSQINLRSLEDDNGHYNGGGDGDGIIFRIGVDSIPGDFHFVRYELGVKNERSNLSLTGGGQGGSIHYETEFEKTVLFGAVYPLNLRFAKFFQFSAGAQGNLLLHNKYSSNHSSSSVTGSSSSSFDSGSGKEKHNSFYLSLTLRQSLTIPINKKLSVLGIVYYTRNSRRELDTFLKVSSRSLSAGLGVTWNLDATN